MRRKITVKEYSRRIARESGLPLWKVHLVLMLGWRNIITMIEHGQEVRITGFGRFYYKKENKVHGKSNGKTDNGGAGGDHRPDPPDLLAGIKPRPATWLDE
jgi:nucleoid DNA-binding protein